MLSTVFKLDPRANNKVFDRAGDKDLAGTSKRAHSGGDVDRYPSEVATSHFTLTGVKAYVELEPKLFDGTNKGSRTANRSGRTIERYDEAVARGVYLTSVESAHMVTDKGIVLIQE